MIPDYADRTIAPTPHRLLPRIAMILGTVPLVCGILIFLFWIPTRSNVFEMLGLLNIVVGVVLVFAGFVCLGIFGAIERVLAARDSRKAKRSGLLPMVVLLANFPACIGIIAALNHMESKFVVKVRNLSSKEITGVSVLVARSGKKAVFGSIAPNATGERSLHGYDGGAIVISFTRANGQTETVEVHDGSDADDTPAGEILGVDVTDAGHVLAPYQSL